MELPGVGSEDVDVEVAENQLVVSGAKQVGGVEESAKLLRRERIAGTFRRVFEFSTQVDFDNIEAAFESGESLGPRLAVMSGFVDGAGPYSGPTGAIIETVEEGIEGIQKFAERGYRQIKLYSSIKPEWVKPLTDEAHRLGLRVSGHIPAFMTAEQAVQAGYDEIQHANMLFLNFYGDTLDTRTPLRFTTVAERGADLALDSDPVQAFIATLKAHDVVVDPTVTIFEGMFRDRAGEPSRSYAPVLDRFPVQIRRGFLSGGLPVPEGMDDRYNAAHDAMLALVRALHEAGITLVAGTDGMAGFTLHRELELYARAGIPNAEVLKIATYNGALVAGMTDELGTVEPSKKADLILIDGNPLYDISHIRRVELTILDGKLYDPKRLYAEVGVLPYE